MAKQIMLLLILLLVFIIFGGCKPDTSLTNNSGTCLSEKEIKVLTAKAEKGDIKAASLIERHYTCCADDEKKARMWTEKRAALGDATAWYNLYSEDENSEDVNRRNKSLSELVKAAEGGYGFAQMRLSDKYFIGDSVKKNYAVTEVWLRRAAQAGEPDAMCTLSILLLARGRTKSSIIESYKLSRHAQRIDGEESVGGLDAMRQAETIRQVARRSLISEKALEAAIAQLPPQKEPKTNHAADRFVAVSGSPRANAELADRQYATGTKEGLAAGNRLLKSAASSCDTYAMSDLATLILLTASDRKSLAEALAWAKLVILDAPRSYMAEDAKRKIEFIYIAAASSGIPRVTIVAEAEKLMARTSCNEKK